MIVSDNENIDISERVTFYRYRFDFAFYFSTLEKLVVVVAYSNLVAIEAVSRLFKCETFVLFPRLFLWRSLVVFLKKEFISFINSLNDILYRLRIKLIPMRKSG